MTLECAVDKRRKVEAESGAKALLVEVEHHQESAVGVGGGN